MIRRNVKTILTIFIAMTVLMAMNAQETYTLAGDHTLIRITGTSSMHDWEMEVDDPSGRVEFKMNSSVPTGIRNLELAIGSDRIFSGNNIMDNKARNALKAEKYPEISFRMDEVSEFLLDTGEFTGTVRGTLSVAGEQRLISIPFSGTYLGDRIRVTGKQSLKMSDFNIEPPKALLGTLKTGDRVEIVFNTIWSRKEQSATSMTR